MNKGIIILGSAASGKSTLVKEIYPIIKSTFQTWNQDIWVENIRSEYYNNPLKAAKHLNETVLPDIMSEGNNFLLDTTGSNIKTLRKITEYPNYQFKAVVVYVNPIIAFIRNFSRERKLPKQVLFENWLKVYSQINDYQELFEKDNIYILETDYSEEEIQSLKEWERFWFKDSDLYCYLKLLDLDTTSTFKKETTQYTPEQILKKEQDFGKICMRIEESWYKIDESIIKPDNKQDIIRELKEWI